MTLVKKIKDKKVNFEFNKEYIRVVNEKIQNNDALFITNAFKEIHPADAADIIENLNENDREKLIKLNSFKIDPEVFIELNESIQSEVIKYLSSDSIVSILKNLESDNAIKILENLDEKNKDVVLIALSDSRFFKIETIVSVDRYLIISDCIDSFNSIKTSGSILKLLSLINFSLSFSLRCSIISAVSAGCISLNEFVINSASLF